MSHTYRMKYYSLAMWKNEILPLAATWVDLVYHMNMRIYIIWNEISQTEKDRYHMISFICGIFLKWYKQTYSQTETDSQA